MGDSIELKAKAKINLSLDVLRKRPDGYHDLKMIMQTIELHDVVRIETVPSGIEIKCDSRWVPSDSSNIAYKAAALILDRAGIDQGLRININKRIPVAAGLAGGSSDAAAVFKGINQLLSLGFGEDELMQMGKQIGADIPYCIRGGTALAEGIGEILTDLVPFKGVNIVLIKPKIGVSTAWVYKNLDIGRVQERPDTEMLIEAIGKGKTDVVAANMKNVLETVTVPKYVIIKEIKDKLVKLGAAGSMMSGSGPSVFGIFRDKQSASSAYAKIKDKRWECYLTETA